MQKKRMEREEEEARLKQIPWIQRVFGAKPPTKEDLMKMAEIELENKTRYSCIWGLLRGSFLSQKQSALLEGIVLTSDTPPAALS